MTEYGANRKRFEMRLNQTPRDRRIAVWIDWQSEDGRDVSEIVKNILDEIITGQSCLTGRAIAYQGEVDHVRPDNPDDPVAQKLMDFGT